MDDVVDSILRYADLIKLRVRLRSGDTLSADERERFAASFVSPEDVSLVKGLLNLAAGPEVAGDSMFALFTRGGIGNLNSEIQAWLDTTDAEDTTVSDSAPLVLAGCVRQLEDGTALRELFAFSYKREVKMTLDHLLDDQLPLNRILRQSIPQQIDRLIAERGQTPSNRFLWLLRTYVRYERVRTYLSSFAIAGRVSALVSYALSGECLDWDVLNAAVPENEYQMRLVVNVALENISRGAPRRGLMSQRFLSRLSTVARTEFADSLSIL